MIKRITTVPRRDALRSRLLSQIQEDEAGCWIWTGNLDSKGYGRFRFNIDGVQRETGTHRAAWLVFRGDIPGDLVVDHLCRVRSCANPDHLELVTSAVNSQRGETGRNPSGTYACGTHGNEDGYLARSSNGLWTRWVCRICRRARVARFKARNEAA